MKKIILLSLIISMYSCSKSRNYRLTIVNGEGWTYSENFIYCDSFQMVSEKEAYIYVDGVKTRILATRFIKCATE